MRHFISVWKTEHSQSNMHHIVLHQRCAPFGRYRIAMTFTHWMVVILFANTRFAYIFILIQCMCAFVFICDKVHAICVTAQKSFFCFILFHKISWHLNGSFCLFSCKKKCGSYFLSPIIGWNDSYRCGIQK